MSSKRISSFIACLGAALCSPAANFAQNTAAPSGGAEPPARVVPPDNSNQPVLPANPLPPEPVAPPPDNAISPEVFGHLANVLNKTREVTLTGWLMDLPVFFLSGPATSAGVPTLQGQPIAPRPSATARRNAATPTQNQPNVVLVPAAPGNVENSLVPVTPQGSGVAQEPGHINITPGNSPGTPPVATTPPPPAPVSARWNPGHMLVLQTGTYSYLVLPDPTLVNNLVRLAPMPAPIAVRGKILERGGMRLLFVNAVQEPGGQLPAVVKPAAPPGRTGSEPSRSANPPND